ncbi:MAG: ABC transporter permease [Chloroflexi bacterium]|nr:MAG: ABC transporter permease [Chloroflexota bacterium]
MEFLKFLLSRLFTYVLVIWTGITIVFFIPRFIPGNPVESVMARLMSQGQTMDPLLVQKMRENLSQMFGLEGTLWEQYTAFLKRVILTQDFGPSLSFYPAPVSELIARSLPWSLALMLTALVISWSLGNLIGLLAGYYNRKFTSKAIETGAMIIYPIPYYILALVLVILFAYIWPIFPFVFQVRGQPGTWLWFKSVVYNSFLPLMSIVTVGLGWWIISMKAMAIDTKEEDFIQYARFRGVKDRKVMFDYVARAAILPQITVLGLSVGGVFGGSLITEILFGYPGVGSLIYRAILSSDYNLMLGTISISIIAVATATLIMDLLYPFIDPRIRHK